MSWETERMRRLINTLGDAFEWYKPRDCTCVGITTPGFESRNCPYCKGTGVIWVKQEASGLRVLVQNQVPLQQRNQSGWVYADQVLATFMPDDVELAMGDKLVLLDKPMEFHERAQRGSGAEDELQMKPVYAIAEAARDTTLYLPTIDYTLNADRTGIAWVTGHGPSAGQIYSARYKFLPAYIAYQDQPHLRAAGLPRTMKLLFASKGVDQLGSGTA